MEMIERIAIVIVSFFAFAKLFKLSSGTLSVKRINVLNLTFYYILVFGMIGGSLIFLGFKDHYLVNKIGSAEVVDKGYTLILLAAIELPACVLIFNRLMGIRNYDTFYEEYVRKPVEVSISNSSSVFHISLILTVTGFLSLIYTFVMVGYVPLLELLKGNFDIMSQRINISRNFRGNEYIRNILALGMIPVLSYLAYIYWRQTKEQKWKRLFFFLVVLSVMCKTYDFEKAPIFTYFFYFYVIETMMGRIKSIVGAVKIILIALTGIVFVYYFFIGYRGDLISLTNGPISRIFITQIATLFLHVQLFPSYHEYLSGKSFPAFLTKLLGFDGGIRSGRVVMENYNRYAFENGTAGVMNSLYIAEAYANWGWAGAIAAPIVVGFFISVIPNFVLFQKKDPINMTIYIVLLTSYTNAIVGGFVDFVYNALVVILIFILLVCKSIVQNGRLHLVKSRRYKVESEK